MILFLLDLRGEVFPFRLSTEAECLKILKDTLEDKKDLSVRGFQKNINSSFLKVEGSMKNCFFNINTPQEWSHYIS